jgi:hypothetical protein
MANTIITKNSSTTTSVPSAGQLTQGELAVNVTDKRLFTKDSGGSVVELGTNPSSVTLSGGTANGVAYLDGSKVLTSGSALTFDGTNFTTPRVLFGGSTLPAAGNPSIALRTSDNVIYHQSGSANTIVMLDSAQNTMQSIGATAQIWNISNSEQMRLTSTGLGIGTSSPVGRLDVAGTAPTLNIRDTQQKTWVTNDTVGSLDFYTDDLSGQGARAISRIRAVADASSASASGALTFWTCSTSTSASEKMRIDSSGNLLVGTTSLTVPLDSSTNEGFIYENGAYIAVGRVSGTAAIFNRKVDDGAVVNIRSRGVDVGTISVTSSSTAYNTSSDYRLKNTIAPMTGALAKVAQLKPCTYKWKADGSDGEGFIAHELAEVCPQAVTGEKDAVDAEGKPVYQGVDTSFLVATLTAAIKELKAEFDAYKASHP